MEDNSSILRICITKLIVCLYNSNQPNINLKNNFELHESRTLNSNENHMDYSTEYMHKASSQNIFPRDSMRVCSF